VSSDEALCKHVDDGFREAGAPRSAVDARLRGMVLRAVVTAERQAIGEAKWGESEWKLGDSKQKVATGRREPAGIPNGSTDIQTGLTDRRYRRSCAHCRCDFTYIRRRAIAGDRRSRGR
jgi:hypothetical protein